MAELIVRVGYSGIIFLPVSFFDVVMTYLKIKTRLLNGFYFASFMFLGFLWGGDLFISGYHRWSFGFYPKAGLVLHPLYMALVTYIIVAMLYYFYKRYRQAESLTEKKQVKLMTLAVFVYCLAAVDYVLNYPQLFTLPFELYPVGVIFVMASLGILVYEQIIISNDRLNEANLALTHWNELQRINVHDLKKPLQNISAIIQLLGVRLKSIKVSDEKMEDSMNMLKYQVKRMLDLSYNILAIEANYQVRKPDATMRRDCDIKELIGDEVIIYQGGLKQVVIDLEFGEGQFMINGDPMIISRIISNLLANACEFTDGKVWITVLNEDGFVVLKIRNTGSVIPVGDEEKIYDTHYSKLRQESEGKHYNKFNHGLGLTFCKQHLQYMGGSIRGYSDHAKKETTFEVRLPSKC